jgi:hypothetical protein
MHYVTIVGHAAGAEIQSAGFSILKSVINPWILTLVANIVTVGGAHQFLPHIEGLATLVKSRAYYLHCIAS